ncbi:MAG TPA: PP2C family protein-serine/threonine phosphatase [Candidatus Acidoferrum sp.]|jgi:serine phosphatase RsbU (regulator of sigma subunit)
MSSVPQSAKPSREGKKPGRVNVFWQRLSEGQQLDELWRQFAADAKATYGFYGGDVDWGEVRELSVGRRPWHVARRFFWALLMKMPPARRVLLFAALLFFFVSLFSLNFGDRTSSNSPAAVFAAFLLLVLLLLELADKVIMKRDLEIAREIQSWLVPAHPPEIVGGDIAFATRPQNSVAGDYYDAFYPHANEADSGKLMLVIADVAGKSVPAALLMATLQASLRTVAEENEPLAELVTRLNRYACAHSLDGRRFTTGVFGQYDPTARSLTYVNAGHNTPVLRRADGSIERLETGGLPLGIQPTTYETATVAIGAGDVLIFFTDGVVEAFNDQGQEYGDPRWLETICALPVCDAQTSLQYLMKQVDNFVGATRQSDDITCMIFRGV